MKKIEPQEEFVPKEWDVFYYDQNRTTIMIEKPKDLGLVTSQDLADLKYREKRISEIILAWPRKVQDLNRGQIETLKRISESEFQSFRLAVRFWLWNCLHDVLYPNLSEVLKTRKIPGQAEMSRQKYWKKIVDPSKLDVIILNDVDRANEILDTLNLLKSQEETYDLPNL